MTNNAAESTNRFVKRLLSEAQPTSAGYASWVLELANENRLVSTSTRWGQAVFDDVNCWATMRLKPEIPD